MLVDYDQSREMKPFCFCLYLLGELIFALRGIVVDLVHAMNSFENNRAIILVK